MRHTILLPLALLPLLLAGCGGSDDNGCGTDTALHPNANYTGAYTVVFTPSGTVAGEAREFQLSVTTDGTISGVVRDPAASATFGGTVTGSALDTSNGCGNGQAYVDLRYTLADGRTGDFSFHRTVKDTIIGTYPIGGTPAGSLKVSRTVQP